MPITAEVLQAQVAQDLAGWRKMNQLLKQQSEGNLRHAACDIPDGAQAKEEAKYREKTDEKTPDNWGRTETNCRRESLSRMGSRLNNATT
jgi:hypothetical protein